MAPEHALDEVFSTKSNVFSFGVVLLQIIGGKKYAGFYAMSLIGYVSALNFLKSFILWLFCTLYQFWF